MMTHAALFVSLVLGFAPAAPAPQTCSLPGLWLGQDRNDDGVGMWLEFAEDGTVVRANGRIVDGEYTLKGDKLTLVSQPVLADQDSRLLLNQSVTFKVQGDQITRKAEAASLEVPRQEVRTRRGTRSEAVAPKVLPVPAITLLDEHSLSRVVAAEAGQPPLVGVWGYKNKNGRTVLERYSPNRHFAVLEPLAAQRGTFTVTGGNLSVTADGATMAVPIACTPAAFELMVNGNKMKFVKFQ